ncbi:MAG: dihydrofolate reductase, partial [Bacteroidota bacterium]
MRINAIVATDLKGTIGKAGEIPWYLPADLKYFKRTTIGHRPAARPNLWLARPRL